ncbi:hypothetical protein SAMN05444156_2874 [Verrucomicrobium sp. GAS474]|uniref:DUF2059 domain-containing protein n=1 Tax=Verrucomicrobium sp. GAS474 TaxID=1882831 RepID=UPI00087CACD4|nr:DUF2059 domain-containing protein [Verrucomicrobium sp. GAS474]SDU25310.1 hypothetical protein SAMN05444156_2874 [Verrucomicrobium sp. GAS474]
MKQILLLALSLSVLVSGSPVRALAQATPSLPSAPSAPSAAEVDPAKAEEIRKLMEVSGVSRMMDQILDQIIGQARATNTTVPTEFWDHLREKLDTKSLINQTMALYAKYYSVDDLKALNAFYQSPAGQHMLAVQPKLMQESMQLGMKWGENVGKAVAQEMAQKRDSQAP